MNTINQLRAFAERCMEAAEPWFAVSYRGAELPEAQRLHDTILAAGYVSDAGERLEWPEVRYTRVAA